LAPATRSFPFGNQKIFSKIVGKGQSGQGKGKNSFDLAGRQQRSGLTARKKRLHSWVAFDPSPLWRFSLAFPADATYNLNKLWFQLAHEPGQAGPSPRLLARTGARHVISIF